MTRTRVAAVVAACLLALVAYGTIPAHAEISDLSATDTPDTVTYSFRLTGAPAFKRVYIDADRDAGTGFATSGVGADYLLENATLFRHKGGGWSWDPITTVAHTTTGGIATWTLDRSDIGETATPGDADLIFQTGSPDETSAKHTHVYTATGDTGGGGDDGSNVDGNVTYRADPAVIANPERGLYRHNDDCDATAFDVATLRSSRTNGQITLAMCIFYLARFKNAPIDAPTLANFQAQADRVREAGVKMILRFAYTKSQSGDDAPMDRVLGHIDQLRPYLVRNADVIDVMQAGFIGTWGEWHYSQNFGTPGGTATPQDWVNRKVVLEKLLATLPGRTVQLRTPGYKRLMYGTTALTGTGGALGRIGHHNDCFLSSANDANTFPDPEKEYPYLEQETRFVMMGGETCKPNAPRSECATALKELALFHYSYLNGGFEESVLRSWTAGGCMTDVKRRLGPRPALTTGKYPTTATGQLAVSFTVQNTGWAAPANPRGLELVLRDTATGTVHKRQLPGDPREWAAGASTTVTATVSLAGIPAGSYRLLLNLPDPAPSLAPRPEYAIRLANTGTYEASTGYNDLRHTVTVG